MIKFIEVLFSNEKTVPIAVVAIILFIIMKFIKEYYSFFNDLFKTDYNKKISESKEMVNQLNDGNELLKNIANHQIENFVFSNSTGLTLTKNKQKDYLRLFKVLKNEITMDELNILYKNSFIVDNILHVKKSRVTRLNSFYDYFVSINMLLISFFLLASLFSILNENIYKTLVIFLFFMIAFMFGIFHLGNALKTKNILNKFRNTKREMVINN